MGHLYKTVCMYIIDGLSTGAWEKKNNYIKVSRWKEGWLEMVSTKYRNYHIMIALVVQTRTIPNKIVWVRRTWNFKWKVLLIKLNKWLNTT